jgi:glycosyltransferase involved in cell wall biosynthesis
VDNFVANSRNVQARIWKTYRRESIVVPPPVAVEQFYNKPSEGYFLIVSELVAYKQLDYAVRVFARRGLHLKVVGDGPELRKLKGLGGGEVEFCGRVSEPQLRELYARARAFLLPGEEDFGIATVEALASGKPVIALGKGGALETVPASGGVHYSEAKEESLADAIQRFEELEGQFDPTALRAWAESFSEAAFVAAMRQILKT